VEHPDTIHAMANLASTYGKLGKYTEAEKLEIQVLDARNRILGVEHPDTIHAMANLAFRYGNLGKYTGREPGDSSSGCKEENSWSGTPRHNHNHGKFSIYIWKPGEIHRGREAGYSSS
jgi:hypothetical protein